jgi:DNA (cytosine-5)-methyltransferase 1
MAEIRNRPFNGFKAVSTFSGCGGSCLGYRMAGFKVLWASEFIPAAADTYRLNHPDSFLDTRDIRKVRYEEILEATGLQVGELDLLDGSPPCASFSMAGKREKLWGQVKSYSDTKQRVDDLFFEYVRILDGLRPKVFVAENVSGLLKGTAKGYFLEILAALKGCGYRVECRLLDAQWLGVPQARQRAIFVGVRKDLPASPVFPKPLPYQYSVRDAIGDFPAQGVETHRVSSPTGKRSLDKPAPTILTKGDENCQSEMMLQGYATGREWDKLRPGEQSKRYFSLVRVDPTLPCPTITQLGGSPGVASVTHPTEKRKFTIPELKRLCAFPDDFVLTGSYRKQWERLGRAVPPVMMSYVAAEIRDGILCRL